MKIKTYGSRLPPQRHRAHRERTETSKNHSYSKKPYHKVTKSPRTHKESKMVLVVFVPLW